MAFAESPHDRAAPQSANPQVELLSRLLAPVNHWLREGTVRHPLSIILIGLCHAFPQLLVLRAMLIWGPRTACMSASSPLRGLCHRSEGPSCVMVTIEDDSQAFICFRLFILRAVREALRVLPIIHINQAFVEHMADLTCPRIAISIAAWQHKRAATRRRHRRGEN